MAQTQAPEGHLHLKATTQAFLSVFPLVRNCCLSLMLPRCPMPFSDPTPAPPSLLPCSTLTPCLMGLEHSDSVGPQSQAPALSPAVSPSKMVTCLSGPAAALCPALVLGSHDGPAADSVHVPSCLSPSAHFLSLVAAPGCALGLCRPLCILSPLPGGCPFPALVLQFQLIRV